MKSTAFLLAAIVSLSLAFTSLASAADAPRVIRFGFATVGFDGVSPIAGGSSAGTAQNKGLFEEEFRKDNISFEWTFLKGAGPAINEALANGLIDFAWQGDLPAIIGRSGGLRTKILLGNGRLGNLYVAVPADSQARTLEELKGKRVAIFKGTNGQLAFAKVLASKGLTEKDFKLINMDGATARGAIATKDIDGVVGGSELFALRERGVARIVYSTRDPGVPLSVTRQTHVLVTEDFEQKYPETVQRIVNVLVKEAVWNSEEKQRIQIFKQWSKTGVGYANYKEDFEGTALKTRESPLLDEFFYNHYRTAAQASLEFKLIRNPVDVDTWFEPKYVNAAIKEQKLEGFWPEFDAAGLPKQPAQPVQ